MNALIFAGWLLSGASVPDTVVEMGRGDRVVLENLAGQVEVLAWERAELSVRGEEDAPRDASVARSGSSVHVRALDPKGRGRHTLTRIRVPSWAALEIRGRELDVSVTGTAGELQVHLVEGDIRAADVGGVVVLTTVEGVIEVDGATGKVSARSRGDDVIMRRVRGEVEVVAGDGDVTLEDITAATVRAETLDGDLYFQGLLAHAGTYWFSVHDGDAEIVVPAGSGVRARVSTFDGEFTSDFPIVLHGYAGNGVFDFVLGDGGASMEIKVFDGEIRLRSGSR